MIITLHFLAGLIDKICFAALFIVALQVPVLNQQYLQYLNGYIDATSEELDHYRRLAHDHGFTSVETLITALMKNADEVVKADAEHKLTVIQSYNDARTAYAFLQNANYFEQVSYFVQPSQYERLRRVVSLYSPGLPLQLSFIGSALITALLVYVTLASLLFFINHLRRRRPSHSG